MALRRSDRIKVLKKKNYNEDLSINYISEINYEELAPLGCVIKLIEPKGAQNSYPFLMVDKLDILGNVVGPIYELLQRFAIHANHIDHHHLLQTGEYKKPRGLKAGNVCVYEFRIVELTLKGFECALLRQQLQQQDSTIQKLRYTINFSADTLFNKLMQLVNAALNENYYRNGKPIHKSIKIPLPLFLKRVKISTALQLLCEWDIEGRKPKRSFMFGFDDNQTHIWFDENEISRTKTIGKGKHSKTAKFSAYNVSLKYVESTTILSLDCRVKRKIGNGRWRKPSY
eukprot:115069_1